MGLFLLFYYSYSNYFYPSSYYFGYMSIVLSNNWHNHIYKVVNIRLSTYIKYFINTKYFDIRRSMYINHFINAVVSMCVCVCVYIYIYIYNGTS
jgi:hypothetical protein